MIITPHTSGFRPDHWDAATGLFAENLRRFDRGEPLLNVVDKARAIERPYNPRRDAEPDPDVSQTIADLPFHIMGRFPKPLLIGRCRGGASRASRARKCSSASASLALGLASLGIGGGDRVAIISESRPEWVLCDLAILALGAVTVPIYPDAVGARRRGTSSRTAGARLAIVSTRVQLEKIQDVRHLLPALEAVIVMDEAAPRRPSVLALDAVQQRGHEQMKAQWGAGKEFRDRRAGCGRSTSRRSSTRRARPVSPRA